MKEQGKTLEEQLSEVEIGNLPEEEFRVMIAHGIVQSPLSLFLMW